MPFVFKHGTNKLKLANNRLEGSAPTDNRLKSNGGADTSPLEESASRDMEIQNYPGEGSHHICVYRHRYILKMSMYSAVVFINVLAGGWNHADGIRN